MASVLLSHQCSLAPFSRPVLRTLTLRSPPSQARSPSSNFSNEDSGNHHLSRTSCFKKHCFIQRVVSFRNDVVPHVVEQAVEEDVNEEIMGSSDVKTDNMKSKPEPRPFWARKWHPLDVLRLAIFSCLYGLCLFVPFTFTWPAFWVGNFLGVTTGMLGITLSYHRHLSHKSFTIPKWLEYFFAYCGVLALQGNPMDWVSTHKFHHQFTDLERDPHSPTQGFWFSHAGWIYDRHHMTEKCGEPNNVGEMRKQPFYRFIEKTYYFHPLALGPILYALGGFPFVVYGMGLRIIVSLHITLLTTSVSHCWGHQAWNTGDLSTNNWWVALMTFGEGWHNNHHAFEYSARHGLEWWEIDMTYGVIRLLEAVGLATNVKLPSEVHKKRMKFPSSATAAV